MPFPELVQLGDEQGGRTRDISCVDTGVIERQCAHFDGSVVDNCSFQPDGPPGRVLRVWRNSRPAATGAAGKRLRNHEIDRGYRQR